VCVCVWLIVLCLTDLDASLTTTEDSVKAEATLRDMNIYSFLPRSPYSQVLQLVFQHGINIQAHELVVLIEGIH